LKFQILNCEQGKRKSRPPFRFSSMFSNLKNPCLSTFRSIATEDRSVVKFES
jgi:hypothetical protein